MIITINGKSYEVYFQILSTIQEIKNWRNAIKKHGPIEAYLHNFEMALNKYEEYLGREVTERDLR